MGSSFLGLGPKAAIDRKDNDDDQGDDGLAESKNSNQQIECRDTGENRDKPSDEDNKFVHKFLPYWLSACQCFS
jgi:hypothetical protein